MDVAAGGMKEEEGKKISNSVRDEHHVLLKLCEFSVGDGVENEWRLQNGLNTIKFEHSLGRIMSGNRQPGSSKRDRERRTKKDKGTRRILPEE